MNKKIAFTVAYIVVAFLAYLFFFNYNLAKYEEEYAILEAEWVARYPSLKGFGPEYFFFNSVWGRNVIAVGIALIYGGLIGAFVFMTISGVLNERRKKKT